MSGPIIRKYGFPNFEKIFGERDLKHGSEPEPARPESPSTPSGTTQPGSASEPAPGGSEPPQPPVK